MSCWSGFCIAGDCDGLHHVDVTGYTWTERQGDQYCVRHDRYDNCDVPIPKTEAF
jgi:hypothetical protein